MSNPLPTDPPGWRMYEQARARRRHQFKGVAAVPRKPGMVLQFPTSKKEVPDAAKRQP